MTYKLYYFNARGMGEPIRYLLKYGKIDFEDVRVERQDWPKLKPTMPYGSMPVLEIDGRKLAQSVAISRFLGNKLGLAGKNDMENFEIDSAVDTFMDLRAKVAAIAFGPEDKKADAFKTLKEETIPFFFGKLNALAEANNGHLACKRLTWADFFFAAVSLVINSFVPGGEKIWEEYPGLKRVKANVESLDTIKKWIAERPESSF